jgi:hypothetical protein
LYSVSLFVHVLGAAGLFVALGLEWAALRGLLRATTAPEARGWLGLFPILRRIYPWTFVAILTSGVYMMVVEWAERPWIILGLLAMLALPPVGAVMTGRRMRRIVPALEDVPGALEPEIRTRLADPALRLSLRLRVGLAVAIVFLMTVKPGWIGSLIAITAFTGLGALIGVSARKGTEPGPAAPQESGSA